MRPEQERLLRKRLQELGPDRVRQVLRTAPWQAEHREIAQRWLFWRGGRVRREPTLGERTERAMVIALWALAISALSATLLIVDVVFRFLGMTQ